ncbi:MAG: hypothetical protein HC875_00865 [Anaerolineales bacterium]|nr:hypothetical protein [Anaerolineales bacterium]
MIKRKELKALVKPARKLIKEHGSAVAVTVVTDLMAYLAKDDGNKTIKGFQKMQKAQTAKAEVATDVAEKTPAKATPAKASKKKSPAKPAAVAVESV